MRIFDLCLRKIIPLLVMTSLVSCLPTTTIEGNHVPGYDGDAGEADNSAPTISNIADSSTNEDTATGAIAFTIGDVETAAASLTVTAVSSNQSVVADGSISLGGAGANRTVTLTPVANANGATTITVTVNDGTTTSQDTFVLTVTAVNDAPTISNIADSSTNEDTATGAIAFTIGDVETAAASLTVTAVSSNQSIVADGSISLGGAGANRTITLTPVANASGATTITVTVDDATVTAQDTFVLTVTAVNDAPTISNIADSSTNEDTATGAIAFTIGDVETAAASLTVTAVSSSQGVVADGSISLGGAGANRTVTLTPVANANGTTTITVTVDDGTTTSQDTFVLTVTAVNDAPVANADSKSTLRTNPIIINVLGNDTDVDNDTLTVSAVGAATNGTATIQSNSRSVLYSPNPTYAGADSFTYTISDGTTTANSSVSMTVTDVTLASMTTTVIAAGSTWKYQVIASPGLNAVDWTAPSYDDSAWPSGASELGYGDGGEATVLGYGGNASNVYVTTYFRQQFTITNLSQYVGFWIEAVRDDGILIYINGREVTPRDTNMPGGAVAWATLATTAIGGADESSWTHFPAKYVPVGYFVEGTNTIAVELHQSATNSSDISFNLRMTSKAATSLVSTSAGGFTYLDNGTDQGTAWTESSYNDSSWSVGNGNFGFGINGIGALGTTISYGADPANKYQTTYYRKAVTLANVATYSYYPMHLVYDDGIRVCVNGTEIYRSKLPSGSVGAFEYSNASVTSLKDGLPGSLLIDTTFFQNGANQFGIEIHNDAAGDTDHLFNFGLSGF